MTFKKLVLGDFVFDTQSGTLREGTNTTKLEPQLVTLLGVMIEFQGETVSRELLLQRVWQNRHVSDDAIRAAIRKLRDALADDARNPKYIKTLPMKGYVLLAEVREHTHRSNTFIFNPGWIVSGILFVVLLLGVGALVLNNGKRLITNESVKKVEYLTEMPGSEMLADYSVHQDTLLFSHRFNNQDPLQLFVKHLPTDNTQQLTWDPAEYKFGFWSPSGQQIAFMSVNGRRQNYVIADYDFERGITRQQQVQTPFSDKNLLGWSADGKSLYFSDSYLKEGAQGIHKYDLANANLHTVTQPNVRGSGDVFAKESKDGKYLAVIREVNISKVELIVLVLATGEILKNRVLPINANRLAWDDSSNRILLSNFDGDLTEYRLAEDQFEPVKGLKANTNDIAYVCGKQCFILREHNGNFLDVQEQPNPFIPDGITSTSHLDLASADDNPFYSHDGKYLFFTSVTENALLLKRYNFTAPPQTLTRFRRQSILENLSVNPQGTKVLGQLDKRIFLYDIESSRLRFLTTELETASNPSWSGDGQSIILIKRENQHSSGYRVSLDNTHQDIVQQNIIALRELADGTLFFVDEQLRLFRSNHETPPVFLQTLKHPNINYWRVIGEHVYVMERSGNSAAKLSMQNLLDREMNSQVIAPHRFKLNFDVHPDENKIVVVKSLLAESDIVRVYE